MSFKTTKEDVIYDPSENLDIFMLDIARVYKHSNHFNPLHHRAANWLATSLSFKVKNQYDIEDTYTGLDRRNKVREVLNVIFTNVKHRAVSMTMPKTQQILPLNKAG